MKKQKVLSISNWEIWTEFLGNQKDPAIVLVSGAGAPAFFWSDYFCERLVKANYFVIRYDHRDVGLSSTIDYEKSPYEVDDLTEDLLGVLKGYELEKAHLVGHSMGGIVVQLFASRYPEKVLSLVCMCTGPVGATKETDIPLTSEEKMIIEKTREINMANKPTDDLNEAIDGYMRIWERWNGTLPMDRELALDFTREVLQYKRQKSPLQKDHPHILAVRRGMETMEERRDIFKNIHAPTLVIQGMEDYLLVPRRGGIALAQVLPQAQLKLIPKMGHMFFNKNCQKLLTNLILDFFQKV